MVKIKDDKPKNETDAKAEALQNAIDKINKTYKNSGGTAIMKLGSITKLDIESVSTGILPLDVALGIGGLPRGRIVEIYGPEASGKTTITLHMIASVQKTGGVAAFIDAEHALDPTYAQKLGVDIDELLISQPDNGEQGLDIADTLISSGAVDIIVIDSVAALVPKSEIDGEMGDASVGLHARMMSKAMRKLSGTISKTKTIVVFINQLREKVGVMFGNPEVTTGGRALKFYSTIRLDVRKGESITQNKNVIGNKVKIKVVKNKVAPPFRALSIDLIYGQGYDKAGGIIDVATDFKVLTTRGAYFYYGDENIKIGNGRDNVKNALNENPELLEEIEGKVLALLKNGVKPTAENIEPPNAPTSENVLAAEENYDDSATFDEDSDEE